MSRDGRSGFAMSLVGESSRAGPSNGRSGSSSDRHARPRDRQPLSRADAFGDDGEELDRGHRPSSSSACRGDEALTGYSRAGGEYNGRSTNRETAKPALVIRKQDDSDWMEERKRRIGLGRYRQELGGLTSMRRPGANGNADANDGSAAAGHTSDQINAGEQKAGLEMRRRVDGDADSRMALDCAVDREETPSLSQAAASPPTQPAAIPTQDQEMDEEGRARAALLAGDSAGLNGTRPNADVTIAPIDEDEALRRDADTRPEAPTLADYARMPVEDFGAALLRGMGWKEGMGAGKNRQGPTSAPELKRRAALLGLGAKERPRLEDDDARGKGRSSRPPPRPERRYVPVVRRERESNGRNSPSARDDERQVVSARRSRSPPPSHDRSRRHGEEARRDRNDDSRYDRDRRRDKGYDNERRERSSHRDRREERDAHSRRRHYDD